MVARVVDTKENNNKSILFFFQTLKGKVKAGKVDCQAYAQTCQKAGIRAYPTVRLYPYERAKRNTWGEQIDSRDAKEIATLIYEKLEKLQNHEKRDKDEL